MPVLLGILFAAAMAAHARMVGFDRDGAFYPVVLAVIASYYVLFSIIAAGDGLVAEVAVFLVFVALATIGFRANLWIVVVGLAAHGLFDLLRDGLVGRDGAPVWWPGFCLAFDVTAALCLAALLVTQKRKEARA